MTPSVLLWRILTLLWAAKIFFMSTGAFGGSNTRPLLALLLSALAIDVSPDVFWLIHSLLRKLAHLVEYGVFGILLYGSLGGYQHRVWRPYLAGWAIVAAAVYALTDELHQYFVQGRGASLMDCAIDTLGAGLAMLALYSTSAIWVRRADRGIAQS